MSTPEVSVLIVTYNSAHVVGGCLSALGSEHEIIVYDNASADDTVSLVRDLFPEVRVIEGENNSGFAVGVNRAASYATGRNIMLLNPDAVIATESVAELVASVPSTHGGIVAPLIRTESVRVAGAGHMPTAWRMLTHYFGLSRLGTPLFDGHYLLASDIGDDVISAEWVTGACMVLDRETWSRLGGLSERWFMYAEDIEFCWRVGRSGGAIVIQPRAEASHLVGRSNSRPTGDTNSAWVVNLYDFYCRDLARNGVQRVWWGLVVGLGLALRSGVFAVQSTRAREYRRPALDFARHSRAVFGSLVRFGTHR